ncbi:MAG: HAD-IIA family hydrolase [Chloroflexi bacterium]|nr:HAD-IIA family hydrolase [Chloroflexota bacterium]
MRADLTRIKALLIDMDGVLYRGNMALPGAADLFSFLDDANIQYQAITNNATVDQQMVVEKLRRMGIDLTLEHVMTSGAATAAYLAEHAPAGARVFVVGEDSLVREMQRRGFTMAGTDAQYVVAGLDRTITFDKLKTATIAIRHGAQFIATNPDMTFPLEDEIVPGAGSIVAAIQAASDQAPLVIGKPEPAIFSQTLSAMGVAPDCAASLGDRLETDILGGQRLGMQTILLMTGVTTPQEAAASPIKPDFTFDDIPALLREWRKCL